MTIQFPVYIKSICHDNIPDNVYDVHKLNHLGGLTMFCIVDIQDEPHIHLRGFTLDDGEKFFRVDHTPIPYKHFENYFRNVVPAEGTHRTGLTFLIAHEKEEEGQNFKVNESQSKAVDWFFPNGDLTGTIYVQLDAINKNLDQRYWYATPSTVYIGNNGEYLV